MITPSINSGGVCVGGIFLWELNRIKDVLLKFRESLFALNQSPTRGSSRFISWNRFSWDLCEIKTFESSANNSKCNKEETWGRSFIYSKNNSGPIHTYIYTYMHTYIHAYIHKYIHTY